MKTATDKHIALFSCLWPASRLHAAVPLLARKFGFVQETELPPAFSAVADAYDDDLITQWTDLAATHLKIEIIPSEWKYSETGEMLRCIGPALLRLPGEDNGEPHFLAILRGGRGKLTVLTPEREKRRIPQAAVRDALTHSLREEAAGPASCILKQAGITQESGTDSLNAIVDEQLSNLPMNGCWLLRLSPGSDFRQQLRQARIPFTLAGVGAAYLGTQILTIIKQFTFHRQLFAFCRQKQGYHGIHIVLGIKG